MAGPPTRNCDLSVTHRVRHHGRSDTPVPPSAVSVLDRYLVVTSVAPVTGVAHALPRTAADAGPSSAGETASAAPSRGPATPPSTGAVIRAMPSVRPDPAPPAQ